jgi:hypothetical protein
VRVSGVPPEADSVSGYSAYWGYIAIGLAKFVFVNSMQNNIFCKQKSNEMKSLFFLWKITGLSARLGAYVVS